MKYKLSICIPTYNRAEFLSDVIDSVLAFESSDVEIVISDNASSDNTQEIVESYQSKAPSIKYFRWERNMGPDHNFVKSLEISQGEYCWFMGSDDAVVPSRLPEVLKAVESGDDIYLVNLIEADFNLKPFGSHKWFDTEENKVSFDFSKSGETVKFFQSASPLFGLFLGYISSVIVKRESWDKVEIPEEMFSSFYSFTYVLYSIINNGGKLTCLSEPAVINRGYNDSMLAEFDSEGELRRALLDVSAYIKFSAMFDGPEKEAFLSIGRRNFSWFSLMKIRIIMEADAWEKLVKTELKEIGCDPKQVFVASMAGKVSWFINALYAFRRGYLPKKRLLSKELF